MKILELRREDKLIVQTALLFLVPLCCLFLTNCKGIPTDQTMERTFNEKRSDFERLVNLSNEDGHILRITRDFTWVDGLGLNTDSGQLGFSVDRWESYKSGFDALKLDTGLDRGADGTVWFVACSEGLSVSGISKGYLYSKEKRNCPYSSLDNLDSTKGEALICKKLDDDWYLYVRR